MRGCVVAFCLIAGSGMVQGENVASILARMDAAAPSFHGVSADLRMITHTAILNDDTVENGTLIMQRRSARDVRAIIDFTKQPDSREMAFVGKNVTIYYPKLLQYTEYDVGKDSNVLNQFLLLGFGSSGRELAQNYTVTLQGAENVSGQDTAKLLLVPVDPKAFQYLAKIEMWIPNGEAYPIQQQFYEPSGNYRKVTYSNIKLNPPIKGSLELKLPPGAQKQSQ